MVRCSFRRDWVPIIPVSLAFISLVLIIQFIFFVRKARNKELYTELLNQRENVEEI